MTKHNRGRGWQVRSNGESLQPLPLCYVLSSPRFWETHDQRFPGSLSLLLWMGRRRPWEQGWKLNTIFLLHLIFFNYNMYIRAGSRSIVVTAVSRIPQHLEYSVQLFVNVTVNKFVYKNDCETWLSLIVIHSDDGQA